MALQKGDRRETVLCRLGVDWCTKDGLKVSSRSVHSLNNGGREESVMFSLELFLGRLTVTFMPGRGPHLGSIITLPGLCYLSAANDGSLPMFPFVRRLPNYPARNAQPSCRSQQGIQAHVYM